MGVCDHLEQLVDFSRIELAVENKMLIVRLIARNRFGEEWDISSSQIPVETLTRDI